MFTNVYYSFNPHTHEGCDRSNYKLWLLDTGFNPHTHEGCDDAAFLKRLRFRVSIHTPTKGVTLRATIYSNVYYSFNPHTHEGCDSVADGFFLEDQVSIHTPTKGVT